MSLYTKPLLLPSNKAIIQLSSFRNFYGVAGHYYGKAPWQSKTIKQKIKDANAKDPTIYYKVNIGLPTPIKNRKKVLDQRVPFLRDRKQDAKFARDVRENKVVVPLDDVREEWLKTVSPYQIKNVAEHYGVYQDLFGDAYFFPFTALEIAYETSEGFMPVYNGNTVKPMQALNKPLVEFNHDGKSLYTLILTNPDGHLSAENSEYVHWIVGNIPDGDVTKGETIVNYAQPFPAKGTGFQRFIFVLYKQEGKIDYSSIALKSPKFDLAERTFSTYDFYRARQDELTPAGLAFCQTDWDKSVTEFFHNTLDIQEPSFEYDFPEFPVREPEYFPLREPFNKYLDRYRDPKQIAKEFLLKCLKTHHPFKPPDPPLKYPNAQRDLYRQPTWIQDAVSAERRRHGVVNKHLDMIEPK